MKFRPGTFKWEICGQCDGHGTVSNPSFDQGWTQSEWADEDEDFKEDYFAGRYDVPCGCKGGKVQSPIVSRLTPDEKRELARERRSARINAEIDQMSEMERRMGA